jgi:hypothetical protein
MMRSSERFSVEGVRARTWGAECDIVNASSGGLFLASVSPPPIGQPLNVELALDDGLPMTVGARVVWINDRTHSGGQQLPPGFGVCIQRIGLTEKLALLKFLRGQRPVPGRGPRTRESSTRGQ